ncbi:hypothetical protein Tco_0079020 [Tanacetum coccineum]
MVNNVTTAGSKAVVSVAKGNGENVVKSLACWIWRPTGNVIDHTSKDSGSYMLKRFDYVDLQGRLKSVIGCSSHMTGNESLFTDYQEIDGGFIAFGGSTKGVIVLELALTGNPQQEVVNFLAKDKTAIKEWEDRMEKATTTASSLEAEQDSGNINRTQSMATLNEFFPQGADSCSGLRLNLLLPVLVYAARHTLTVVRHKLMLSGITCYCWFWTSAKAKIVNGERQIQALVDKKKVIITETSIRSDLMLDDAEGIDCLPTATIFVELERMGGKTTSWNEFSSTMASAIISTEDMGKDSAAPTDSHSTPIHTQPSSSKPQKKKSRRKQRKDSGPTEPILDEATNKEHVATPLCDPPQSGEDRMQLTELMDLCTQLQSRVLALETIKSNQALEIESLKRRVKSLEKRRNSRTPKFKRLRKFRSVSRVESSNDVSLGAQEDASK